MLEYYNTNLLSLILKLYYFEKKIMFFYRITSLNRFKSVKLEGK